jgi:hypothetical protein
MGLFSKSITIGVTLLVFELFVTFIILAVFIALERDKVAKSTRSSPQDLPGLQAFQTLDNIGLQEPKFIVDDDKFVSNVPNWPFLL